MVVVLLREEKAKHSRFAFFRRAKTSANSERGAPDTSDRTRRLPGWACLVSSASRLLYACRRSPEKCEQIKPVLQQIKERPQEIEITLINNPFFGLFIGLPVTKPN